MVHMVLRTGLVQTQRQAELVLLLFALGCIALTVFYVRSLPDAQPVIEPGPGIDPETMLPYGVPFPE